MYLDAMNWTRLLLARSVFLRDRVVEEESKGLTCEPVFSGSVGGENFDHDPPGEACHSLFELRPGDHHVNLNRTNRRESEAQYICVD